MIPQILIRPTRALSTSEICIPSTLLMKQNRGAAGHHSVLCVGRKVTKLSPPFVKEMSTVFVPNFNYLRHRYLYECKMIL